MPEAITFDKAIEFTKDQKKLHALLGNGFSIACRPEIFDYKSLLDCAELKDHPKIQEAFDLLDTTDFELLMHGLQRAADLVRVYDTTDDELPKRLQSDADALKDILVNTIAGNHPELPSKIMPCEYAKARSFLQHFDRVYSTCYDLLAYWAYMQDGIMPNVTCDDGFRQPEDGPADWVEWDMNAHNQTLFYLHGALHIYQDGPKIRKYTWSNTGIPLIKQIRSSLEEGKFPLFVAEGSSKEKMERIQRSSFLGRAYRSFRQISGALFVHGFSFSENDDHILDAIAHNKVSMLMISLYGDPDDNGNREIINRVESLKERRRNVSPRNKNDITVKYYDAASAEVW